MNEDNKYYLVTTEWLYPTESGCDVLQFTYDSYDEAVEACVAACEEEIGNYSTYTDPLPVGRMVDELHKPYGACILAKNGHDEWWFAAKVIEVNYGIDRAADGKKVWA